MTDIDQDRSTVILPLAALRGACREQMKVVLRTWPAGIPLSEDSVETAIQLELDLDWLVVRLLRGQALAEYERVRDQAVIEYRRARDQARAECERVRDQAWVEYESAGDQARAECLRVEGQAQAAYRRACGSALARVLTEYGWEV